MFATRSLFTGLIAGLLLALLLHKIIPSSFQSSGHSVSEDLSSTGPALQITDSMAQMLSNTLRAARYRAWIGGGYKSASSSLRLTPVSSFPPSTSSLLASTPKAFSASTSPHMSAQKPFLDAIKERRTIYALNKEAPISDKQIVDLAEKALLHVPSSFNSQSTRLVVLLNKDHEQFWDYLLEILKPLTPEDMFPKTAEKIKGFRNAYGSVCVR